jgi:hypothetical protein
MNTNLFNTDKPNISMNKKGLGFLTLAFGVVFIATIGIIYFSITEDESDENTLGSSPLNQPSNNPSSSGSTSRSSPNNQPQGQLPSQGCATDAECSDGIYCNGIEKCTNSQCVYGNPVTCDDGVSCTTDSCNEQTKACESVPTNTLCDDNLFCNGAETCDLNLGCIAGAAQCGENQENCNEEKDTCEGAESTQCSNGIDDDSDGLIDFPNDPGCDDSQDDDETDTENGGEIPQANLLAHWKLDDLLSGSIETSNSVDASGNANHMSCAAANCPTHYPSGIIDGAYDFNGNDEWFSISDSSLNGAFPSKSSGASKSFTISAWIEMDTNGVRNPIVVKQTEPNRGFVFEVISSNKLRLESWPVGSQNSVNADSSISLTTGTAYHVAVTYNVLLDTARIFINGQQNGNSINLGGTLNSNSADLDLGRYYWSAGYHRYFDGRIDDVAIWDRALSDSEIQDIYNLGTS